MFNWICRIFGHKPVRSVTSEYESQQRERIHAFLVKNPDASEMMRRLIEDFEARSLKEDKGGSSSSPISSP